MNFSLELKKANYKYAERNTTKTHDEIPQKLQIKYIKNYK